MFGLKSIPFDREIPFTPEECLRRLERTVDDQFRVKTMKEIRNHEGLVRLHSEGFQIRLDSRASVEGGTPRNQLEFEIRPQGSGARLVGNYRLSNSSRVMAGLFVGSVLLLGSGMTLFLLWAAIFAEWTKGGENRFLISLIALVPTAVLLALASFLNRVDRTRIDSFLDRAFDPETTGSGNH